MPASETAKTARPGGSARAFWTPANITSMPLASISTGTVESEDTVSTMSMVSGKDFTTLAMPTRSLRTPVEVSEWMNVTVSKPPSASFARTTSGSMAWPHSTCTASASKPHFFATSSHLSEKAPQHRQRTFFFARLRSAPSITPQAEEVARKTGRAVPKISCRTGWVEA